MLKVLSFAECDIYCKTRSVSVQIAGYIGNLVKDFGETVKLGVVQTAYANGSSTRYINDVLVSFSCLVIVI